MNVKQNLIKWRRKYEVNGKEKTKQEEKENFKKGEQVEKKRKEINEIPSIFFLMKSSCPYFQNPLIQELQI